MIAICVVDWCAASGAEDLLWCVAIVVLGWLIYRAALALA
jgi:hypothetical protein